MKVQFLIDGEDDEFDWRDLYINENEITGFYMPDDEIDTDPSVNILLNGSVFTFKQSTELLTFLSKRFVNVK